MGLAGVLWQVCVGVRAALEALRAWAHCPWGWGGPGGWAGGEEPPLPGRCPGGDWGSLSMSRLWQWRTGS